MPEEDLTESDSALKSESRPLVLEGESILGMENSDTPVFCDALCC